MTMTRGAGGTIPVVNIVGMGFMWYRQVEMQRSLEEMQLRCVKKVMKAADR
jgi:hypothetical protein